MKSGALPWYGGKSPCKGLTRWIVSRLPWERESLYVEPFAGMLGVLLSRRRVNAEIVNDRNGRVVNWWRCIRDHPDAFGRALDWTHQRSREEFDACVADLDHVDPIRRAVAFTVVTLRSIMHTDVQPSYRTQLTSDKDRVDMWQSADIMLLHDRTRTVQIENCDAVDLLDRIAGRTEAVVYCDPPYRTAYTGHYSHEPDWAALTAALKAQRGRVAVSGYEDEWDHLGWRCETYETTTMTLVKGSEQRVMDRTEKLWLNYDPLQTLALI